jgi:hypothetical protein
MIDAAKYDRGCEQKGLYGCITWLMCRIEKKMSTPNRTNKFLGLEK